ncbi:MAG: choline dehydrogenase-like flavoprotein [Kiritimatiellia bacterium]|jgi:choline dehydrogenase-like flavoprotein
MSGEILGAAQISADIDVSCDVAIVGTGAGGAVLAAGLAEAGLKVVMIEAGPYVTRQDFTLQESQSLPLMYQESGARSTTNKAITVLQGRAVGGSTAVNWTSCFRTPERILEHWREKFGLEMDHTTLRPHFEAVERRLSIQKWPKERANQNNQVIFDGCAKLGWKSGTMRRNVKGCADSGYCGMGCPVGGKQSMFNTYVPDAVGQGAMVYADTYVQRIEVQNDRVVALHGRVKLQQDPTAKGVSVTVRPKVAVLAAGALNGPALLLRSGLDGKGLVGRRTFLHPVVALMGHYKHVINPWYGAPQSAHSHQFIDRGPQKMGYFFESAPLHPVLIGGSIKNFGTDHVQLMQKMKHMSAVLSLMVDGLMPHDVGGTVSLTPEGTPALDYPHSRWLKEAIRSATRHMAQLHFAAGATEVASSHTHPRLLSPDQPIANIDKWPVLALEPGLFSAHQMGGCTMGADPEASVVDLEHRFRGVPNLFVVDGSVLPTALGVNPSETIYGLSHRARPFVGNAV